MSVTVEGPYGCFDFKDEQPRQIWVGAGIGITPFIAKLKQRAEVSDDKIIDLFHTTSDFDESALEQLTSDAKAAGVNLHLLVSSKDGRLNAEVFVLQFHSGILQVFGFVDHKDLVRLYVKILSLITYKQNVSTKKFSKCVNCSLNAACVCLMLHKLHKAFKL